MSRHWAKLDEVGFLFGMRLLYRVHCVLGRLPLRLALYPVVAVYWLASSEARRSSRDYLRRLTEAGLSPGRCASLRHFLSFAETILDKLLAWTGGLDPLRCIVENAGDFLDTLRHGQGGIIVTAHFGNFEVSRALGALQGEKRQVHVLVHTRNALRFNQLMAELNPASQLNLIQVTELDPGTVMRLAARVAEGDFLVITGDRVPVSDRPSVVSAPFLGSPAPFPTGPWILASVLQVPVFLMWAVAEAEGFRIRFERFRDRVEVPRRGRREALVPLVADFASRLEAEVRRKPLQWFNFFDFWSMPESISDDKPA
jgi:predicted LPLAT superfamily acyltransferase